MFDSNRTRRRRLSVSKILLWAGLAMLGAGAGLAARAGVVHHVSQKGRAFSPNALEIRTGDVVEFMNDDGELLHHAFLESEAFSFDTGDQEPGSKKSVAFPAKGTFMVLCGIHPKMRLIVRVQ